MKIVLVNFKKHKNLTIELIDGDITRLVGGNGRGKSTIFDSIEFILYDQVKKPYSHGETSCSGTLYDRNVIVHRTKKPSSLYMVDEDGHRYDHGDAEAQITQMYGSYQMFMSMYISKQDVLHPLFTLTPLEARLDLLMFIALRDSSYVDVLKDKIKSYNDGLAKSLVEVNKQVLINGTRVTQFEEMKKGDLSIQVPDDYNED